MYPHAMWSTSFLPRSPPLSGLWKYNLLTSSFFIPLCITLSRLSYDLRSANRDRGSCILALSTSPFSVGGRNQDRVLAFASDIVTLPFQSSQSMRRRCIRTETLKVPFSALTGTNLDRTLMKLLVNFKLCSVTLIANIACIGPDQTLLSPSASHFPQPHASPPTQQIQEKF